MIQTARLYQHRRVGGCIVRFDAQPVGPMDTFSPAAPRQVVKVGGR